MMTFPILGPGETRKVMGRGAADEGGGVGIIRATESPSKLC